MVRHPRALHDIYFYNSTYKSPTISLWWYFLTHMYIIDGIYGLLHYSYHGCHKRFVVHRTPMIMPHPRALEEFDGSILLCLIFIFLVLHKKSNNLPLKIFSYTHVCHWWYHNITLHVSFHGCHRYSWSFVIHRTPMMMRHLKAFDEIYLTFMFLIHTQKLPWIHMKKSWWGQTSKTKDILWWQYKVYQRKEYNKKKSIIVIV